MGSFYCVFSIWQKLEPSWQFLLPIGQIFKVVNDNLVTLFYQPTSWQFGCFRHRTIVVPILLLAFLILLFYAGLYKVNKTYQIFDDHVTYLCRLKYWLKSVKFCPVCESRMLKLSNCFPKGQNMIQKVAEKGLEVVHT